MNQATKAGINGYMDRCAFRGRRKEDKVSCVYTVIVAGTFRRSCRYGDALKLRVHDVRYAIVRSGRRADRPEIDSRSVAGLHNQSGFVDTAARGS